MSTNLMVYKDALSEENLEEHAAKLHTLQNDTVRFLARKQIEVGRILLKARKEFKGDKEFGQWRETETPIGSRQTATKLMELARQHETGRITNEVVDKLPTSTLFELLSAPASVVQSVVEQVESGEVPSQKAVRAEVKEAKSPEDADAEKKAKQKVKNEKSQLESDKQNQDNVAAFDDDKYNDILQEALPRRIAEARKEFRMSDEWSWVVFGIPPFANGLPHEDVVHACYKMWTDAGTLKDDQIEILNKAFNRLMNMYK